MRPIPARVYRPLSERQVGPTAFVDPAIACESHENRIRGSPSYNIDHFYQMMIERSVLDTSTPNLRKIRDGEGGGRATRKVPIATMMIPIAICLFSRHFCQYYRRCCDLDCMLISVLTVHHHVLAETITCLSAIVRSQYTSPGVLVWGSQFFTRQDGLMRLGSLLLK